MGNQCCRKRPQVLPQQRAFAQKTQASVEPDVDELKRVFNEFDLDGDNLIQLNELRTAMSNMGTNAKEEEIVAMFQAADVNSDGGISFDEFVKIARANPVALSLKSVFADLDRDGDGYITRDELVDAFNRLGHSLNVEEATALCRHNDVNMDGKLNFDEFVRMMCRERKE